MHNDGDRNTELLSLSLQYYQKFINKTISGTVLNFNQHNYGLQMVIFYLICMLELLLKTSNFCLEILHKAQKY